VYLSKIVCRQAIAAGHDVQTLLQAGLIGVQDNAVFASAVADDRTVLTINCADFIAFFDSLN